MAGGFQSHFDAESARLTMAFASAEALKAFLDKTRRHAAFDAELPVSLPLYAKLTAVLSLGGERWPVATQVIQVFPGDAGAHRTALMILEPGELEPPRRACAEPAAEEQGEESADAGETTGVSPAFAIRQMNVTQRMRLAMKGSRTERQILLRDNSPQVMMGLLGNPRLEDKELLEIVRSNYASPGVLQRIAGDRKWTGNYEVQLALVRNPKTPPLIAKRLLPGLRKKDLGVLAKSTTVREHVKKAALRLYLKKM